MQIRLTSEQALALRRAADERNLSKAAVIRELIDLRLRSTAPEGGHDRAVESGASRLSREHDTELESAFD